MEQVTYFFDAAAALLAACLFFIASEIFFFAAALIFRLGRPAGTGVCGCRCGVAGTGILDIPARAGV